MRAMDRNCRRIKALTCDAGEVRAGVRSSPKSQWIISGFAVPGEVSQLLADHVCLVSRCIVDQVDLGSCLDAYAHLYIGLRSRHRCSYPASVA
jgi:hypothetical protein